MNSSPSAGRRRLARFFAEPLVHFFLIGAVLFVADRLIAGNPRVIVVTPGVKAEVARRFRDTNGRAPTAAELDQELHVWERDEALSREALRDRLDQNDATIRTLLADRVRARASISVLHRAPTEAELEEWLAAHRSLYETPRRYDYQTVTFPKSSPAARADAEKFLRAVQAGVDPATLGRPIVGANLPGDELAARVGAPLAARIAGLPVGSWTPLETADAWVVARLAAVSGGLPAPADLHARLVADWTYADHQQGVAQAVQKIVDRYRIEEQP